MSRILAWSKFERVDYTDSGVRIRLPLFGASSSACTVTNHYTEKPWTQTVRETLSCRRISA